MRKEVEGLQKRYLRWVLGVERCVLGYMKGEELQRDKREGNESLGI